MKFSQPLALVLSLFLFIHVSAQSAKDAKMNQFVSSLMQKMTIDEKIGQLNLLTPGGGVATGAVVSTDVEKKIKEGKVGGLFGVIGADKARKAQEMAVNQSRLKIPLLFGSDVIHGHKTTFPIPLGLACSWDIPLIERSARIAATEATADGLSWAFSPMVDIARDPRWGRIAEGSGEDAYLGSLIAKAMVRGYQGDDLGKNNTLMACVKHYALYGAAEAGRDYSTTDMGRIRMFQDYLPPYKAAVEAGVGSVMSSFNEVDGIPATGNKFLMTDVLRTQWGFKGFVVTDYTSINEMINHGLGDEKGKGDLQAVSALALKAGIDMDMVGEGFLTTLKKSLQEGRVTQKQIDDACRRILEAKYKLGLFTNPFLYADVSRAGTDIMTAETRKAAREIAARSFVLLKNNQQTLPLKKTGTIALIGPLANDKRNMLGTWSVSGDWKQSVSVMEGVRAVAGAGLNIIYAKGANISDDSLLIARTNALGVEIEVDPRSPDQMISEAVEAANKAEVAVAVVGEAADMTGEASSRSDIGIPQSQKKLLEALFKTGKPVVLVLFNGRPITIPWENEQAMAILDVWFGGTEAGNAVADVLFGNYNPSGKLTTSFPRNVGQIPIYYNHKNTGRPFRGEAFAKFKSNYLDVSNDPLFPFGFGLSYTNFTYGDLKLSKTEISASETIEARITVTNSGNFDGAETVQLYIQDLVGTVARPVKELKGFQKIQLPRGESKELVFKISIDDLKFYNKDLKYTYEPGEFKVYVGTNSRDVKEGKFSLR
jgi:beta-glucosidase